MLALPALAGSAAYALGETLSWHVGLARLPPRAKAFYATIAVGMALGVALNFSRSDQGALLERGAERRRRGAGDGHDDAADEAPVDHGGLHAAAFSADHGLAGHRNYGSDRRRDGLVVAGIIKTNAA